MPKDIFNHGETIRTALSTHNGGSRKVPSKNHSEIISPKYLWA